MKYPWPMTVPSVVVIVGVQAISTPPIWPANWLQTPTFETGVVGGMSVFVPLTVPTRLSIENCASNWVTGPLNWPGKNSSVWGPIVAVPVSVNVPGYGPNATPLTANVKVESPSGLQLNDVAVAAGSAVRYSPVSVGATWAAAVEGIAKQTSAAHVRNVPRIVT